MIWQYLQIESHPRSLCTEDFFVLLSFSQISKQKSVYIIGVSQNIFGFFWKIMVDYIEERFKIIIW